MSESLSRVIVPVLLLCATSAVGAQTQAGLSAPRETVILHDKDVAREEPGPNGGTGESIGYYFFGFRSATTDFAGIFRKRVLHKGASVGLGLQDRDEVYYILKGTGVLTVNGVRQAVEAGTAIL